MAKQTYQPYYPEHLTPQHDTSAREDCRHCQAESKACGRAHFENIAHSWKIGAEQAARPVSEAERQAPVMPEYGPRTGAGSKQNYAGTGRPASQKQVDFIEKLLAEKNTAGTKYAGRTQAPASLTGVQAHDAIEDLLKLPRRVTEQRSYEPLPDVHEGRYALDFGPGAEGNQIRFYIVDRPTEGRWAGRTFVKRLQSDEAIRCSFAETKDVLNRIVGHEQEAMERFGRETETCGHCGRRLTNDESRQRGIGPVCAAKMGW